MILADETTTLDFHLAAPVLAVDPVEFTHTQNENVVETVQNALTLENTCTGTLNWSSSIEYHNKIKRNGNVLIAVHLDGNSGYYDPTSAYSAALTAAGYNVAARSVLRPAAIFPSRHPLHPMNMLLQLF